jgi:hypothetical protein
MSQQFTSIHWEAYHKALQKHLRSHRISITKLSYSLWNTNKQNHRYYRETSLCPSCKLVTEDIAHVFTCQQPEVKDQWISNPMLTKYLAPTSRSLLPQLQSITCAFQDQTSIGWEGLFRGHIAASWAKAYVENYEAPSRKKQPSPATVVNLSQQWSVKLILQLLEFSKTVWAYRNSVVHGKTEHSKLSKELLTMRAAVSRHYEAHRENQHYIPQSRASFFNRPEAATVTLCRDAMASWLALVEEAVQTKEFRQAADNTKITQFFIRRPTTSDIRLGQDILRAPFSAGYYRRTKTKIGQPRRSTPNSFPPINRLNLKSTEVTGRPHPETTLFHHGLFTWPSHKPAIPSPNKSQRDKEAEKTEYSGTLLSTVP